VRKMKQKRQARIVLGFLLAALLLLPGGMRIKAEEMTPLEGSSQEVQAVPEEQVAEDLEVKEPDGAQLPPEPEGEIPEAENPDEDGEATEGEDASAMKTMAAPAQAPEQLEEPEKEVLTGSEEEEKRLPELDLSSFDCDFIWGEDCDCEGGPVRWSGIEKILGMHIRFLPKHEVQCITVEKIWQDGGSRYRPCAVMVDFYANGIKVAVLPIMSNGTDHWKIKILVPKTVLGKEISYTVKEVAHPDLMNYRTTVSGLKITNALLRDIEVEKLWKEDHESVRPDSVSYWLMRGDAPVGGERTLSAAEGWKDVIYDVPAYDEHGAIDYSIKEAAVEGYETEVTEECLMMDTADKHCGCEDPCPDFTIINTFTNEKDITLMKKWVDEDPEDRPEEVTFILDKSDGTFLEIPVTSAMGWEKEVTVEIVDENWIPFDYAVDEKEVPEGYEKLIEGFTITNSKMELETILIEGEKTWMDGEEDIRPESIHVTLMANGVALETKEVVPVEGKWRYSFGELPKYDAEQELIEYEVVEEAVEGYVSTHGEGFNLVNWKAVPVEGEKTWMDDGTGRPEFIMVKLLADDLLLTTMKVMPDEEDKWYYDFGMLPVYDEEMKKIVYTVSEEAVEGYEMVPSEGYDLVNRRVGKITITGEKTWDDLMNRPESITVYLNRNVEQMQEVVVKADEDGKWLYSFAETEQFDEEGKPYTYTGSERYVLGYSAVVEGFDIENVQMSATMRVLKVNEADKPLAGAVFEIRDLTGKVLKTFTTGADGTFAMELPLGMYRLVEVSPPAGYAENTVPRLVVLFREGEVMTVEVVNEFEEFDDVSPKPIPTYPTLPKTGDGSVMGFYLLGFASIAAGMLTLKKKNKI